MTMCKKCHTVRLYPGPATRFRVYGIAPDETATLLGIFNSYQRALDAAATVDSAAILEDNHAYPDDSPHARGVGSG